MFYYGIKRPKRKTEVLKAPNDMGQQTSRKSNGIYFHQKVPSLFSLKNQTSEKPEEPIKFQYKIPKKKTEKHKNKINNFDNLGFNTINNLKSVLDGVKNECSGLKKYAKDNTTTRDVCNLKSLNYSKNKEQMSPNLAEKRLTHDNNKIGFNNSNNIITNALRFNEGNPRGSTKVLYSDVIKPKKRKGKDHRKEVKTKNVPIRTNSEPNLRSDKRRERAKYKRYEENSLNEKPKTQQFGYEIQDVDEFLAKATLAKPANIPVVLAFPSVLYQTRIGGYQAEISLPLGMVVNAIFKNQNWLYVQTPHAEEGYISYSACLPLGIIPPSDDDKSSPCWEKSTDIFPKPSGNMTDTEKMSCQSENEDDTYCPRTRYRTALSTCGEKSVDRLYLRAAAIAKGKGKRHTLLVINEDYKATGKESISVSRNEVVVLLNARIKGWFYVKNKEGQEGFIPSVVAGHGFL